MIFFKKRKEYQQRKEIRKKKRWQTMNFKVLHQNMNKTNIITTPQNFDCVCD